MTERIRVRGDNKVHGQTSQNMAGDPPRLPKQTTHDWLDENGAAGAIEVSPHWGRRRGSPPRPKSKAKPGVQMAIDDVTEENDMPESDGQPLADVVPFDKLARRGRKTGVVVERQRREQVLVSNVTAWHEGNVSMLPSFFDTPGGSEESISDCGTIGTVPCPGSTTEECRP